MWYTWLCLKYVQNAKVANFEKLTSNYRPEIFAGWVTSTMGHWTDDHSFILGVLNQRYKSIYQHRVDKYVYFSVALPWREERSLCVCVCVREKVFAFSDTYFLGSLRSSPRPDNKAPLEQCLKYGVHTLNYAAIKVELLKGQFPEKKCFLLDFGQITSPFPQFGQLVQLYSDVDIQDLKVSLGLKILFIKQVWSSN